MNDLGLALAWLMVQDVLVLTPALAVHAWASRRGPAAGTWVASVSLAMVLALGTSAFWPRFEGKGEMTRLTSRSEPQAASPTPAPIGPPRGGSSLIRLPSISLAWARIEGGVEPAVAQWRPWGKVVVVLAGTAIGVGLARLVVGLWAIGVCRRRGKVVDDKDFLATFDALRMAMGCRRTVAVREVADLASPATAGWWRPMILLPDDWRGWDDLERRAVLAHELAHVVRSDYAAGLVARLAVVLHAHHPMVGWMAAKLVFQQEMAADALGARFAGGRASYRLALARLAMRQDGRSPSWLARAFLPRRGALIRRIMMLRDDTTMTGVQPWTFARKAATALALVALTLGVGSLHAPALGDDKPAVPVANPTPVCFQDGMDGIVSFRPAATFRRAGMQIFAAKVDAMISANLRELANGIEVDTAAPGFRNLGVRDIEWVASGIGFGVGSAKAAKQEDKLHRLEMAGFAVRTIAPIDWLAFLRQWKLDLVEIREPGRTFYRVTGVAGTPFPETLTFYAIMPDDRTLMTASESAIRAAMAPNPKLPAFLDGPDWEKAKKGLLAVVVANDRDKLAKGYDLGRPDDAVVLSLVNGVDRWTFGVDDADAIALHAVARTRDDQAAAKTFVAVAAARALGRLAIGPDDPKARAGDALEGKARAIAEAFFKNLRVRQEGPTIQIDAENAGTFADLSGVITDLIEVQEGIDNLNKKMAELDRMTNGPEVRADRERYHREMDQYGKDMKEYLAETELYRQGKTRLQPVPPIHPVPAF